MVARLADKKDSCLVEKTEMQWVDLKEQLQES